MRLEETDWYNKFSIFSHKNMSKLLSIVDRDYDSQLICPAKENLWRAFFECPLKDLKVVILGQDPYYTYSSQKPVADGLAFSYTKKSELDIYCPPSLLNILKEVERTEYDGMMLEEKFNTDLTRWANQGVLLLNTALTVRKNKPLSKKNLWNSFIKKFITDLSKYDSYIWLLLGKQAEIFEPFIHTNSIVLKAGHPSPKNTVNPFVGSGIFKKTNEIIEQRNGKEFKIKW